jgi:phospholipid/cholesterol/gamma-HCH transport system substrate-binding protein
MTRNAVETVMGAVVLVVAAVFLFFAYTTTQVHALGGYQLTARFTRIDGLRDGADVRISGIKVGNVVAQSLDPKTFEAVIRLSLRPDIKLPVDSIAKISSNGLLGDKYLGIEVGVDDDAIKHDGVIAHTVPPVDLESLIGSYIFGQAGQQQPKRDGETPAEK